MPAIRRDLIISKGQVTQQELLAEDIDIDEFKIIIQNAVQTNKDIGDRIVSAEVTRTIEGASTLEVGVSDQDRTLWRSGNFASKLDVNIDGLWWRLAKVEKAGDLITMTFEDREIGILRTYTGFIPPTSRASITRAEFILRLLNEVKEITIPYVIPELHDPQPVYNRNQEILNPIMRGRGINPKEDLTVKRAPANAIQKLNADQVLHQADNQMSTPGSPDAYPFKRKIMVCAMMTAIVESELYNKPPGTALDGTDSYGIFQQRPSKGWLAGADIPEQTRQFVDHAVIANNANPNIEHGALCQKVQGSAFPDEYDKRRTEADHWVNAYSAPGGDAILDQAAFNLQGNYNLALGKYRFYRGIPPSRKNGKWKPESSWECIKRLANEVNWVFFFVSGTFYYMSEDQLFKSSPRAIITEDDDGIDYIDGDYDPNKKIASVNIDCRMGRFLIPPGSIIKLKDNGPFNGRWLVTSIERDLFNPLGTITLRKPNPEFMEPNSDSLGNLYSGANTNKKPNTAAFTPPYLGFQWNDTKFLSGKVLEHFNEKPASYRDDNGRQIAQWRKGAAGLTMHSQCGFDIGSFDPRIAQVVIYLIETCGYYIGTYAMMEDHRCKTDDGNISDHAVGAAIDISTLGNANIGFKTLTQSDPITKKMVMDVMLLVRNLGPSQVICNGVGGRIDFDIKALQWDHGKQVSFITKQHTTHIHVGFSGS